MQGASLLQSPRWTAIYRCVKHPKHEVVLTSVDKPEEERTFRVSGVGNARFRAVSITPLREPKGGFREMAKKRKRKTKSKKEEPAEELEGLEGLEDDLEDLDEDEPDDVEEDEDDSDDDEDEDEEEEKPKRKKKGKGKKGKAPPTRELPKGKYGAGEIAKIAGVDARAVRLFLRKKPNKKKFPKDKELGRYAFTKKVATQIAKAIVKAQKD